MRTKLYILTLILTGVLISCSDSSSLELKTKSISQNLNRVSTIGNKIGDKPIDFTVITTDGKAVTLSDFTDKGKPIVIYFMATWCPFCAEDYAELSKVYQNYEKNISFLSISLDLSEDLLLLKEYKNKYPKLKNTMFATGQSGILSDYGVTKTTTKYAIGKDGTIIFAGYGVFDEEQWKILLDRLSE